MEKLFIKQAAFQIYDEIKRILKEGELMKKPSILIRVNGKKKAFVEEKCFRHVDSPLQQWKKGIIIVGMALFLGSLFGIFVLKTFSFAALSETEERTAEQTVYKVLEQPPVSLFFLQHGVFKDRESAIKELEKLKSMYPSIVVIKREEHWVLYSDVSLTESTFVKNKQAYKKQYELATKKITVDARDEEGIQIYFDALPQLISRQHVELSTKINEERYQSFTNYKQAVDQLLTIEDKKSDAYTKQLLECVKAYEEVQSPQ